MAELCPICNEKLKAYTDYMDHILVEEGESCPNKHYEFCYAYGYTDVWIGDEHFSSWDNSPVDVHNKFLSNVKAAEQRMKKLYQESLCR